jgi:hypothetical protein
VFELSRVRYPDAKIFGLTTGLAVMKINSDLGYEPVTYSELTNDEEFWKGCQSCVNYDILMSKGRKNCMCTAMLFDPAEAEAKIQAAAAKALAQKAVTTPQPVKTETVVTAGGDLVKTHRRGFQGNFKLFERWVRFKQFVLGKRDNNSGDSADKRKSILSLFFW